MYFTADPPHQICDRFIQVYVSRSLIARGKAGLTGTMAGDERVENLIEEARWQKAVIVAVVVRPPAQVVARPKEFVSFGDDDP